MAKNIIRNAARRRAMNVPRAMPGNGRNPAFRGRRQMRRNGYRPNYGARGAQRPTDGPVFGPPTPDPRSLGGNGRRVANWVKSPKGIAAGAAGVGVYGLTQRSGRSVDRTNYNTSRGIYGY